MRARCAAAWLLAGALAGGCGRGRAPTAAEVLARNAAARGGAERWRAVETMVWLGHVESARAPVPGMRFELDQKRPNRTRLQLQAAGERSARVFDGARGWKVRWGRGAPEAQPYAPQELLSAQAGHGIDGPLLDAAARGSTVTLEGLDRTEGREAYHLKVHLAKGGEEDVWVDAGTWLEVRFDRQADGPTGALRRVSVTYDDYRTVDGLRLPFRITTGGGPGTPPDRLQLETVSVNPPLDDATFENPAAPRPRGRLRWGAVARGPAPAPTPAAAGEGAAPP